MRRIALVVVAFTLAALLAWPYLYLYRLDRALAADDVAALAPLVDLDAVRASVKSQLGQRIASTLGGRPGSLLGWIQSRVEQIGERAVDVAVDLEWVRDTLRGSPPGGNEAGSLLSRVTYAFYDGWDRFLVRLGEVDHDPVHFRMALEQWRWRVVEIYE